jgi:hypothetical protein
MSYRRNGLRALGLSLLAIAGLMAFMAAGAQANWLVNGVELTANESVAAKAHTEGKLAVPAKKIEFRCKEVAGEGLKLVAKSGTAEGKVKFTKCLAFSPIGAEGKEQKNCNPKEPITAGGKALLILHNAQNYVLFEPETGKPFTTVEVGELCALTQTSNVTGSLVAECGKLVSEKFSHLDCNTSESSHLIQPAPATLFESDKLSFGASPATLEGIAAVELNGEANAGKPWAGHI